MNMLKRTLAMVLVLCMLFSVMPVAALADDSVQEPAGASVEISADETDEAALAEDEPDADAPEAEEPKVEEPKVEEPKVEEPKVEEPKVEEPKVEEPKVEEPKVEEPEAEEPKAEEPKAEDTQDKASSDEPVQEQPVEEVINFTLENEAVTLTGNQSFQYRILHLDCGRKYFTADWIKALINEMAAAGYNQLQLAFGNDGLRFLLDDMSVSVNGTTYSSANVTAGVKQGNKNYYDAGDKNELTQAEMDSIITYANSKGIAIVPHMNMPGHMDAILDAIEYVGISDAHFTGYTTSARSLNLNNDAAVAFTKALLQKYVDYFAGNGCKFFHIGADEYANDAYSDSMGFPTMGSTLYTKFATFVNDCADIVKDANMTPRAWNDGISYTGYSDSFDTDIQITYWSQGWWGYSPASASTLSANGHDMINTNGSYYFILTKSDGITNPSDTALNFDNTAFAGDSTISNPVGSMFCIWCDYPGTATEQEVAAAARITLRKMAAAMNNSTSYSEEVVSGGFNADGSIAETRAWNTVDSKEISGIQVSGYDLTNVVVTEAEAPDIADTAQVLAWDITPYVGTEQYTDKGDVRLPVPADWTPSLVKGFYVENGQAVVVNGTYADGFYTFQMPHFSVGGIMLLNNSTIENTVNVRIPVGGTSQTYTDSTGNYEDSATIEDSTVAEMHVAGKAGAAETTVSTTKTTSADELTDGATFIIRYSGSSYALTSNKGETTWGDSDGDSRAFEEYSGAEADNMWTLEASGSGYKLKCAAGYLNLGKNAAWITASGGDTFTLTYSDDGWAIGDGTYNIDALGGLNTYHCAGGWPNSGTRFDLYKVTTSAPASTEVSFTGLKIGTTTAVIGNTQYNIEVLDPNNMFTKEKNVELLVDEVKTITDNTGNYEASYTGAGLDENIAKVAVEGATVEGGKTPVPVTSIVNYSQYYVQLTDGKYLTSTAGSTENADDAALWSVSTYNYNASQVYIYSGNNYLFYNNGSFTPTSNNWTIYDFNAGEISVNGVKLGTIVNLEESAPVDVTDITITGVSKGETKVIVGETRYNITVIGTTDITIKYQTANGTLIKTETVTVADNATAYTVSNFTHTDGKYYVVDNTTLNITPATVTEYAVTVTETEEDLTQVASLSIEYWQTNARAEEQRGNAVTSKTVTAESAYSEAGIELSTIIPVNTYKVDSASTDPALVYWRSRLLPLPENQQTGDNGDDETLNGTGFTKVRYWSGNWAVYTDAGEWQNITLAEYQLVAYYMNDMELADEVSVATSDWGKKGNGEYAGTYLGSNHVSIAFQVVYEGGTTFPADTTAASLASYTYFVDNWGNRGVGTIGINQIGDYQIWKVTAETGEHSTSWTSDYDRIYFNSVQWDGNEMTVWEDAKNPVSQYTIQNPAKAPRSDGYYDNLRWNETNESILIRIYIKAVETEDSLKVVYFDEKFGDTLVEYNVIVPDGSNFNDNIVVANTKTPATLPAFATNANRKDATGYGIVNALDKTQNFRTDLTQVPEAVGKYNNGLYTYTGSEVSADGKTITHFYTINTNTLSPNFVVDFGLPLTFPLSYVLGDNQESLVESVSVISQTRYGTLSYDPISKQFTYTPIEILENVDVLSINIKFTTEAEATLTNVGVTPATTVYYEEGFLSYGAGWSAPVAATKFQATEVLGDDSAQASRTRNNYGYDPAYVHDASGSNGTNVYTTTNGATASFTFTGTGFALYANCNDGTGYVTLTREGETKKMYMMDTGLNYADLEVDMPGTTETPSGDFYNIPVIAEKNLPYGEYTVTIRKTHNDGQKLEIDGFRVYEPIDESHKTNEESFYRADKEDKPVFYELRDLVLTAIGNIGATGSQVYNDLGELTGIITSAEVPYANSDNVNALLNHGPKNEIYLYKDQTLTFKVKTDRVMQIGLKAPNGATTYDLICDNGGESKTGVSMNTSVDMFYHVGNPTGAEKEFTVRVKNLGDKVLAVTELKVCDDPNFAFLPLTEADISGILKEETEPEAPSFTLVELKGTDVTIDGTEFQYTGKAIEPAVTVTVDGTQLVEGKDYSVTYTNNVEPGTATVTVRGIATASETLGYTGEVSINYTITAPVTPEEPEIPEETTKPTEPEAPTEPEKPGKPEKPEKPGQSKATAELKIELVDYTGKKIATAKLTEKGTSGDTCYFKAQEILKAAKSKLSGKYAIVDESAISGVETVYGESSTITVQVGKVATLKITFINLRGKKVGTATLTKVQTNNSRCTFQASEIRQACPAGRRVLSANNVRGTYGKTASTMVIVF